MLRCTFWNFIKEKKIFPLGIFLQKEDRKTHLCKNRWMIGIAWSENNLTLISTKHSLAGKTFKILMISQLYDIFCSLSLQPAFLQLGLSTAHVRADWLLDWRSAAKWAWLLITYLVAALSLIKSFPQAGEKYWCRRFFLAYSLLYYCNTKLLVRLSCFGNRKLGKMLL